MGIARRRDYTSVADMLIRNRDRQWTVSWWAAMHALKLDGTGALHPCRIKGTLRIERGGVCLNAYRHRR